MRGGTQSARGHGPGDQTLAFYDTLGALTWQKQWDEKASPNERLARSNAWIVNSVSLASNAMVHLDGLSRALSPFLAYHTCNTLQVRATICR